MKKILVLLILFYCCCSPMNARAPRTMREDTSRIQVFPSATVLTLSGLNFNVNNYMPAQFHGLFTNYPYTMVRIKSPASIASNSISKGVAMLDEALRTTPGPKIVLAHSQGAQVCSRWMR